MSFWNKVKKFQLGHALGDIFKTLPIPGASSAVDLARALKKGSKVSNVEVTAESPTGRETTYTAGQQKQNMNTLLIVGGVIVLVLLLRK